MSVHCGITDAPLAVKTSRDPIPAPALEDMLYFLTGRHVKVGWRQTWIHVDYQKNLLMCHSNSFIQLSLI